MNKMKFELSIESIASLFTVLIGLHIYQSYLFTGGLLESYGINAIPLLSMNDLIFPYGMINTKLFLFSFSGFVISLLFDTLIYRDFLFNEIQRFYFWVRQKEDDLSEKRGKTILILFFIALILIFSITLLKILNSYIDWAMFLTIIVIPIALIVLPKQKSFLIMLQLIFVVIWLNLFAQDSIADFRKNETKAKNDQYNFTYLGRSYHTDNDTIVIFHGYENMIVSYGNGKHFLNIPTEKIENLRYSKQ